MSKIIFCLCTSQFQAQNIAKRLHFSGYPKKNISVLFLHDSETRDFPLENSNKTPNDSLSDSGGEINTGGMNGWILSLDTINIPGVGPFMAAGPITTLCARSAICTSDGCVARGLIGLGLTDDEAQHFEIKISEGNIFLSVNISNIQEADRVIVILKEELALNISSSILLPTEYVTVQKSSSENDISHDLRLESQDIYE